MLNTLKNIEMIILFLRLDANRGRCPTIGEKATDQVIGKFCAALIKGMGSCKSQQAAATRMLRWLSFDAFFAAAHITLMVHGLNSAPSTSFSIIFSIKIRKSIRADPSKFPSITHSPWSLLKYELNEKI